MDGAHVVVSSKKQRNVDPAVAALQEEGLSVKGTVSPARKGKGPSVCGEAQTGICPKGG